MKTNHLLDFVLKTLESVDKILSIVTSAIADGLSERKAERAEKDGKAQKTEAKPEEVKVEAKKEAKPATKKAEKAPVAAQEEE